MKRWLRRKLRHQVVVYTPDQTFVGVLDDETADGLVLIVASLGDNGLPGQVFIPRERITAVQIPPKEVLR